MKPFIHTSLNLSYKIKTSSKLPFSVLKLFINSESRIFLFNLRMKKLTKSVRQRPRESRELLQKVLLPSKKLPWILSIRQLYRPISNFIRNRYE